MIKDFVISFRLRNTYKANGFIYFLRQLPLVKKLLPASAYKSRGLKKLANVIALIREVVNTFLWKGIYLALIFAAAVTLFPDIGWEGFLNAFFFLTLAGGFLNTQLFDPTNDKYYAIILMGMDARSYTLSNYAYFLIRVFIGFLPLTCLFAFLLGQSPIWGVWLALFVLGIKLLFSGFILWDDLKSVKKNLPDSTEKRDAMLVLLAAALLCVAGFGLPLAGVALPVTAWPYLLTVVVILAVFGGIYIFRCREYKRMCRELLKKAPAFAATATTANQVIQANSLKKIDYTAEVSAGRKKGYAYFNALFFARHRRLLHKPAKRICVITVVIFAVVGAACALNGDIAAQVNEMVMNMLPLFLFIMYLIHPGRSMTQALFMNCDHSMLSYRFYRQPKVILSLFVERLKSLSLISLIPAAFIGVELALLLAMTGGTDNVINYILIIVTILMMSVFFSVHYMVLYYLLQPYNIQLENRNAAYGIANFLTYIVCYGAISRHIPTMIFGTGITLFCLVYIFAALVLVYRLAPKTFRLR
ncbi:hypothetical protein [Catenibacillus scindens]|uniref:hypothetical protein n=1 Tax=Catenibacillus scindens TaxID=673271 RepID=UPI003207CA7E